MRRFFPLLSLCLIAAAPVRDNSYVAGTVISPSKVMANEDTIYTYLQGGVDTYKAGSIGTTALQDSSVTSAKITDGTITTADLAFSVSNQLLPSGAVFFMISGSCPSWTTNVSATYANKFVRINATPGTNVGADTHTHGAGSYAGPSHQHTAPIYNDSSIWMGSGSFGTGDNFTTTYSVGASSNAATKAGQLTSASGTGAITGTSASGDNVPAAITMIACQVN